MITNPTVNPALIEAAIEALATQGYAILPNWIAAEQTQLLAQHAQALKLAGLLTPASTGKQAQLNTQLRGDSTYWLADNSQHSIEQAYLNQMSEVQNALNQALYLGLASLECHFAIYPIGTFYKKHLDQFINPPFANGQIKHGAIRQVSSILYLNDDWQTEDGGQLRLYLDENAAHQPLDICPIGGTLVLFMSSRFYHEVLPAKRERLSITGWFKSRDHNTY